MNLTNEEIKYEIFEKAHSLGANLVRCCSVAKWEEIPIQEPAFWPQNIWPWTKNVIVLGVPLYAPMIHTTPSMVYQELYDTSNRILDDMAYQLTNYITTKMGYRAIFFPRDCYYNIEVLLDNPNAAFSHVIAAYYAGMGSIGDSHNLITKEFGPRVRMVSILTDAPINPDDMLEKNLCIHCKKCLKNCPSQCFKENGTDIYSMDKVVCTQYHVHIKNEHHWPCGVCIDVCPVGEDLKMYRNMDVASKKGVSHCQHFGS
ncbi:epoxyqueuosine reductase [Clostridium sp. P21]|uniref:Epoxyqueuosine reductase n=1 Tax=Clostridium muellerianum TaxID=2716538 RepID=A0A7Y0HP60_9CLOT|nr:epoxyqueuosine reductase [Clostridium muellerianum]NMM63377.1 epoxyqueuosine reductase [Clostridium muellerianum]